MGLGFSPQRAARVPGSGRRAGAGRVGEQVHPLFPGAGRARAPRPGSRQVAGLSVREARPVALRRGPPPPLATPVPPSFAPTTLKSLLFLLSQFGFHGNWSRLPCRCRVPGVPGTPGEELAEDADGLGNHSGHPPFCLHLPGGQAAGVSSLRAQRLQGPGAPFFRLGLGAQRSGRASQRVQQCHGLRGPASPQTCT